MSHSMVKGNPDFSLPLCSTRFIEGSCPLLPWAQALQKSKRTKLCFDQFSAFLLFLVHTDGPIHSWVPQESDSGYCWKIVEDK
jgi:hypothetical protein